MLDLTIEYNALELSEEEKNNVAMGKFVAATSSHYRRLKHLSITMRYSQLKCANYALQLN